MKHPVFFFAICLLAVACNRELAPEMSVSDVSAPAFEVPAGSVPGVIRVKFKTEPAPVGTKASTLDLSALEHYTMTRTFPPAGKWEPRHRAAGLHLWYDISFDKELPLTKAGDAVAALEEVEIVEFIPMARPLQTGYPFNDPRLPEQWHYHNPGGRAQWSEGCDVNAFRAWTVETGKPQVIVAVNDTGVDYTHEDLADNIWVNEAELNGLPGEDDDNNGYVDDIHGYSFLTLDGKTPVGKIEFGDHGTHVAGTIAAVNNNGIGVSGVAGGDGTPGSGVRIMTTPTLDGQHNSLMGPSFVYAADNGAVLVNCSWGLVNNEAPTPQSLSEAIDYFNTYAGLDESGEQVGPMAGGLVVFAAGNDGREVEHPAMDDNVFAVAALSANYIRSYYTSFGEWVDISAPGGDANRGVYVLSTLPNNTYGNHQGSSMATPHVTGVAALIVSHYGVGRKGFTRDKLIYLLQSTANKKALEENGSYATRLGAGLVDAFAALTAESSSATPNPVNDLAAQVTANRIDLRWTIPAAVEDETPYSYNIFYGKGSLALLDPANPGPDVQSIQVYGAGKPTGTTLTASLEGLEFNTAYHLRICSESLMGNFSELSAEQTVSTGSNSKPVVTPLDGTSLALSATGTGALRFRLSDADGHTLEYEGDVLPGLTYSREGDVLTLTVNALDAEDGRNYEGSFSVTDGYATIKQSFSYSIRANKAPERSGATIDDQIFGSTSESRTFELGQFFSDPDGETLSYSIKQSSTSIIVNASVSGGVLTVTGHSYGQTTVTVTASDARGKTAELSFRALVRDASRPADLYPNPVVNTLNIRPGQEGQLEVSVTNRIGATVWSGSTAAGPFNPLSVDLSDQPGGLYYVRIDGAGINQVFPIAKQ